MAYVPAPEPRLDMPELFYPGRKPVGRVKIDWSHPLARGLTFCSLPDTLINLIGTKVSSSYDFTESVSIDGKSAHPEGSKIGVFFSSDKAKLTLSDNITVMCLADIIDTTGTGQLVCRDFDLLSKRVYQFRISGGNFEAILWPGVNNVGVTAISGLALHTLQKIGTTANLFINSDNLGNFSCAQTVDNHDVGISIGSNARDETSTSNLEHSKNPIFFVAEWGRALSDKEISMMYQNPYQFLIPDRG